MSTHRIVIVGRGIVGASTAYYLARRGAAVTVLDRDESDDSASCGNAGLIALGHPPLPRPGVAMRALRWMFEPTSPLYVPPRLSLSLARWLWGFHRACAPAHYRRSMDLLALHGRPAGECFARIIDEEKIECEYRPVGQLQVFRTPGGVAHGEAEAEELRAYGYDVETISGDELRRREPVFRSDVAGATLYRDSAFANPQAFTAALAASAQRRGAVVRRGVEVASIESDGVRTRGVRTTSGELVEATHVVLAAGMWTTRLAQTAGVRVPMEAGKGYHVMVRGLEAPLGTAAVLAERFVAATPMDGGLRLAGTLEFSGINHRLVQRRLDMLARGAAVYLRGIDSARATSSWCGLRPCTADGLPVVGSAPRIGNLFIATGHAMMGFTLGPLTGKLIAEWILDGRPSLDTELLSPARFAR